MELTQDQVATLNVRIEALHQMVEQLGEQTAVVLSEVRSSKKNDGGFPHFGTGTGRHSLQSRGSSDASMAHKDVLLDSDYPDPETHQGERTLAPEIQIQRLTAQLTAAYNRIAALEEQLLARRTH
ncbi:hypothetical protein IQ268_02560 [Oculatella sp. LEGE 06141]|uniref:hypothetical protein n=1 Tax=Oculatella sp. LEGE 06141 TaxID=1828648 RepID=UPI001882A474|nr:hypothetical protein [Oculatella sp. LEGE 06141]MBE9177457.1 hypothetical protein [Oculatella sp. LEGE 06141]